MLDKIPPELLLHIAKENACECSASVLMVLPLVSRTILYSISCIRRFLFEQYKQWHRRMVIHSAPLADKVMRPIHCTDIALLSFMENGYFEVAKCHILANYQAMSEGLGRTAGLGFCLHIACKQSTINIAESRDMWKWMTDKFEQLSEMKVFHELFLMTCTIRFTTDKKDWRSISNISELCSLIGMQLEECPHLIDEDHFPGENSTAMFAKMRHAACALDDLALYQRASDCSWYRGFISQLQDIKMAISHGAVSILEYMDMEKDGIFHLRQNIEYGWAGLRRAVVKGLYSIPNTQRMTKMMQFFETHIHPSMVKQKKKNDDQFNVRIDRIKRVRWHGLPSEKALHVFGQCKGNEKTCRRLKWTRNQDRYISEEALLVLHSKVLCQRSFIFLAMDYSYKQFPEWISVGRCELITCFSSYLYCTRPSVYTHILKELVSPTTCYFELAWPSLKKRARMFSFMMEEIIGFTQPAKDRTTFVNLIKEITEWALQEGHYHIFDLLRRCGGRFDSFYDRHVPFTMYTEAINVASSDCEFMQFLSEEEDMQDGFRKVVDALKSETEPVVDMRTYAQFVEEEKGKEEQYLANPGLQRSLAHLKVFKRISKSQRHKIKANLKRALTVDKVGQY